MTPNLGKNISLLLSISLILFITGCGGCGEEKPFEHVEMTPEVEELQVHFDRFDNDLFNADFSNPQAACQQLYHKYGSFFCDYVEGDLMLASCQSDTAALLLAPMLRDASIRETHAEINTLFNEEKLKQLEPGLTTLVRRYKHFFPDSIAPHIVYYQSAWNNNILPSDSAIGIALDTYLGADNHITKNLSREQFPKYKKDNMDSKFIIADAAKGWAAYNCKSYYKQGDFLNDLVFYGKLMIIAEALAPEETEAQLMKWSDEQLQWANQHEYMIWKEMANEKIMYMTKRFEINKWFADAPFTNASSIPQDSPPQLGVWIGWKMVKQYMLAHPETNFNQLLTSVDSKTVLNNFKPVKP